MKRIRNIAAMLCGLLAAASPSIAADQARNVIVLISDGWGPNHILATDYYQYGQTGMQTYESFPVGIYMSTYMVPGSYDPPAFWADFDYGKSGATDSAAAATAMSTGQKSYNGAIGVDTDKNPLVHFMQYAEDAGKATGVVTSVEFSHATPAGYVAHNVSRNNYADIAREMILDSTCEVIMGAGNPLYDDNGNSASTNDKYIGGLDVLNGLKANATAFDLDGDGYADNMVEDVDGDGVADPWTYIEDRDDFQALMTGATPKRVIGVPKVYQTLQYNRAGVEYGDLPYADDLISGIPTLAEMTAAAINVLDNDEDGFVLMIEGGAVDWAAHANMLGRLIEEQMDFNDAVDVVVDWVEANSSWDETLVIVTGDHECGYLWGPDCGGTTFNMITSNGKCHLPNYAFYSGDHSNQIIPLYVKGAGSGYFTGEGVVGIDPVRGDYTDNTRLFSGQMAAAGLETALATVMIDPFTCEAYGTVSVPVYVDMDEENLGSYSFDIAWDTGILSLDSVSGGDTGWDSPIANTTNAASGSISVSAINPSGSAGRVMVAVLGFTVAGDAGDVGYIDVTVNSMGTAGTLQNITDRVYVWDCEYAVTALSGIWGDADGNGSVDSFDGLIIASYVIGIDVGDYTARVLALGDVNADGEIGLADAYACVLYDVDPANASLPARIGNMTGTVAKQAGQVASALSSSSAVLDVTSLTNADNLMVVQASISADTELGAASVMVRWDPAEYSFSTIEDASGIFVANTGKVLAGEITMAIMSTAGASELVFPGVVLESISMSAGTVTVTGIEAIESGSLAALSIDRPSISTAVENDTPATFVLEQNVPNPFNPTTTISFSIPTSGHVALEVYNVQGQKIRTLVNGVQNPGTRSVVWDATDDSGASVSSGIYIYRLAVPGSVTAKSMTLVR